MGSWKTTSLNNVTLIIDTEQVGATAMLKLQIVIEKKDTKGSEEFKKQIDMSNNENIH